jgi:hypothetical protein
MADDVEDIQPVQQEQEQPRKPVGIAQFARGGGQDARAPRSGFNPSHVVLHDYGGTPKNEDGVFNPYHTLVFPDGSVRYRNPDNPYGAPAPHAYKFNPYSVGLSYAGQVGSTPTPEAMSALRGEYGKIKQQFPDIQTLGHGEAYAQTRNTDRQASRDGRELQEASWRTNLNGDGSQVAQQPRANKLYAVQDTPDAYFTPGSADKRIAELQSQPTSDSGQTVASSDGGRGAPLTLPPEPDAKANPLYADSKPKDQPKKDDGYKFTPIPMLPQRQYAVPRLTAPDLSGYAAAPRNPLYG